MLHRTQNGAVAPERMGVTLITLSLPKAEFDQYAIIGNVLLGPVVSSEFVTVDNIVYRSRFDQLLESRGTFHENIVKHNQIDGEVIYQVVQNDLVPEPTSIYPKQVRWSYKVGTSKSTRLVPLGLAYTGATGYIFLASSKEHYAMEVEESGNLIIYKITATSTAATEFKQGTKIVYSLDKIIAGTAYYNVATFSNDPYATATRLGNWSVARSYTDIKTACLSVIQTTSQPSSMTTPLRLRWTPPSLVVDDAKRWVDSFIMDHIISKESPLEDVHYGVLASEASERFNANNVNMLELIRDLRKPWELIPKLKNLSSLRTLSNNFLVVNYGILPTIDDLSSIVDAFARVKPYLDRNGFNLAYGGHSASAEKDGLSFSLEQRIKIAYQNEEEGLLMLINKLESIGIFPTFSNVWELIPFSFVLDWFIDVGDWLERVDSRLRLQRHSVRYVTMSHKEQKSALLTPTYASPISGAIRMVHYSRWTTGRCPVPPLSLSITPTVSNHWLEAGALIIMRRK